MKIFAFFILCSVLIFNGQAQNPAIQIPAYRCVVLEVVSAPMYTYFKARNDTMVYWVAVATRDVKVGDTLYHGGALQMNNFESKELNRTFPEIYFVDKVAKSPEELIKKASTPMHGQKKGPQKEYIKVDPVDGGISLEELFRNRESYAGKIVRISGKVIKFNEGILKRNWAHLQDGSEYENEFDLTVTLQQPVKVGDIITVEGIITLNKDFGSGYFFKILMEEASVLEEPGN